MSSDPSRPLRTVLGIALAVGTCGTAADAAVTLLGVQYQQDNPYAEYNCWYHYGSYPTSCGTVVTGCNVHVFLKNTGGSSVTINDVTLAGYSLKTILKRNTNFHAANSIFFYWDNPPQDILDAGEPVWYRADPNPIPAGGVARVVVRLRSVPVTRPVSIGVVTSAGTINTTVPVNADAPVLASVGFSADRTKVYLHWRRSGGAAPVAIYMDGTDVTASATTVGDVNVNFAATVLQFATPLANMSYHVYQGVYADGKTATGSLRTWVNRFIYGTWGVHEIPDNDAAAARAWIDDCNRRGVNAYVMNTSGGLQDFMSTSAGRDYAEAHDYGYVKDSNTWGTNPRMWFIDDEPDIEEGNIECGTGLRIPCGGGHTTGILGLHLLEYGESLRAINPAAPTTINLDGNFKPDGWYAYGQLADVMMMDSYYEQEMAVNHWYHPERDPLYTKPTSIYAAAIATTTAAEPNPMHMILYSCEYKDLSLGYIWPFPTPASKRIQAYYALAGGAKGMAYWWYKKGYPFNGLDAGTAAATALWKEIGLIGNEIKTAQPLLVTGHPVTTALTTSPGVWARTLAVGVDSMILIAVNDQFYNDATGTHLTPVTNANVTIALPSWLASSPVAFAVSPYGISDVGTLLTGNELLVCLGTLNATRLVVITTNPSLKSDIESRYLSMVRPGICAFAAEYCTPLNTVPTITMQPDNITVQTGNLACFAVSVAGTGPFSYQWQKNGTNLSNGGGISGANTPALQIAGAGSGDAGSYRCVVSNSYGSVTSNAATLTVTGQACGNLTNASFEDGSTNGVGLGWVGYQRAPNPTTVWSIQTASPPPGSGSQYQQILNTSSAGGAGVRQDITGCIPGVTYTISGWMRTNSASATCTVKCSPTASTDWSTAIDLNPPQTTTSSTWVAFSGTVTATGSAMTIWLDGQTGGTGLNKAACFDAITVTCNAPAGPAVTQQPVAQSICPGGTATFTVAAAGDPPLNYQWQKNGANLSEGGHYSGTATPALTVWNAGSTDAGDYRCVVSNASGSTISNTAALTLKAATQITQHPAAQSVCSLATATFHVAANGDGALVYQWQKNGANLSNGGHYSGVTTAALTISNADAGDAAGYRCVVTAGCGSATSDEATLTVVSCNQLCLQNTGFEDGFTNGAGTNWTRFVKAGTEGAYLSFSDETAERHAGLHSQEVYSHDVNYDGGVYQQFSATPGATYTASAWFKCYCPEAPTQQVGEGWLGIDPTGGIAPNGATVWWGSAPSLTWAQKSYTFSAQSSWVTVFLRGRSTKTPDKGRSAYVWIDDVQVVPAPPTDGTPTALGVASIRWSWTDLAIETGYRVKNPSGTDLSGLLPADTTQWNETNGLAPNTPYTRQVYAVTPCGESGPSVGMTRYTLIETPTGVALGAVSTTSITVSPLGTFSNLTTGSSGLLTLNTTAGTTSGWAQSQSPWVCTALTANTPYRFVARARNGDGVETPDSPAVWKWTLSIPPGPASITPSDPAPCTNSPVVWTPSVGFGAGSVQSYRWAWDQNPTRVWTGEEPAWSSGTIETIASAPGTWYLHVQGCNGENIANGTYDYAVIARAGTVITQEPVPQQVSAGGTAVFTVAATGDGTLSYRWQKNGVFLSDDGHCTGTATPTLTVTSVTVGDAAGYSCVVGGGCGEAASNTATLTVLAATADFDGDGDVDLSDFAMFQGCFNGPNQAPQGPSCPPADFDGDADVDLADFAVFQSCFGGPNRPPRCG